ncbi:hypothetical protein FD755_023309 [Muntiacus reevesi]|uniref:DUF4371 domain-containing protein n=1 Tax=Muntiacus reevesi TaxID=9886 RepID=A0A5N3VXN5_MUNRE|nr:hypothetical protein FD755_023309 [Muntiacus reevesi]
MPNFCAAPNCTQCQKWVENCRRADLEEKTPDQLNKHYQLFLDNAIPTIFNLTSHLNNPHSLLTPDNFQALLECWINSGEEVLRKRFETTAVNTLFCSKTQQKQMLEICESCIWEETLREVRDSHFFSIITDDVVNIAGEEHLPVLMRLVDEAHNLREEFVDFLPYEADAEILAVKFHTTKTEKWGLNMEYCHGQAYIVSSGFSSKMKVVASRLLEKYPQAIYTLCPSCPVNMWLAKSVPVMGVYVALRTIEEVCSFFHQSPQLLLELENVIFVLFQNNEERGKELKGICHSQGKPLMFFFAATSLTAVLHSLNKVMENIEGYHEFWFEEATSLATKLDIQMKLPGKFRRAQHSNLESQLTSESYYKETLITERFFSEQHLKTLKCLLLVPSVMGQLKFNTLEEHYADMYRSGLPNPGTLSAELHYIELPSSMYEALHLPDIKFFPNVYALLKVLCILPVMKHLKAYLRNTLTDQSSSNLALLNINFDIKHDLDLMVDTYIKLYTSKSEFPTDNSETTENT